MTAEPARVISVMNPRAWRIVAGLRAIEERPWKPYWRGVLWIHVSRVDKSADIAHGAWRDAARALAPASGLCRGRAEG